MIVNKISLRLRIFAAMFLMILLSSIIIGIATFLHFQQSSKIYHEQRLARKEKTILETLDYAIADVEDPSNPQALHDALAPRIMEFADINDIHINIFTLDGKLIISSQPGKKTLDREVTQEVLKYLSVRTDRIEVRETSLGQTYLNSYTYIYNFSNEPIAILNLPYYHDDSLLKDELFALLKIFSLVVGIVLLFGAILAYWLAKNITGKFTDIADRLQQLDVVGNMKPIYYSRKDEISVLVAAYNEMLHKFMDQSQLLLKNEREETWREAARQVAHEIKNPLTPMRLQIQRFQMKYDPDDPNNKEKINDISEGLIKQIDNLSMIAEAFSDFAKMPAHKDVKMNVVKELQTALEIYDDNITFSASEDPIWVIFDHSYLVRVINNLVKNAVQAVPLGTKPEIEINVETQFSRMTLSIADNGTGIEESMVPRLFEPKFSTKTTGAGLGLPMVKKLVEEYDGTIRFKNRPSGGVVFIITLPLAENPNTDANLQNPN
ncbi:MAG: ATP-binding protein [Weeksellaceae bacterium]|nr:ATP-binding protein [Weeksellaceae bacterium]